MQRSTRRTGVALTLVGLVLALVGLTAGPVKADPPGNNGTVTIDGRDLNDGPGHSNKPNDPADDGTDNDPHVTCRFELEFFNFDEGQTADIQFSAHAPTGNNGELYDENKEISPDGAGGAGNDLDRVYPFDVLTDFDTTQFTSIHPVHGWHVKLNITVYDADGKKVPGGQKHKVFWVEGCAPEDEECPEGTTGAFPECQDPCNPQTDENRCEEPCNPEEDPNGCEEPCNPEEDPNGCEEPSLGCLVDCTPPPPPPVDQCTDALNPGMQLDAALCNVPEVEGEVLVPPTPDGPDVLGEVIVRPAPAQLPRTGSPTAPLVAIGLLLIVAGAHVMRLGRERTAPI